jgi:hypothetical protein
MHLPAGAIRQNHEGAAAVEQIGAAFEQCGVGHPRDPAQCSVDVTAAMHRLDTECPIGADLVRALPCQCRDACRTDNTPRLQVRDMELEAR